MGNSLLGLLFAGMRVCICRIIGLASPLRNQIGSRRESGRGIGEPGSTKILSENPYYRSNARLGCKTRPCGDTSSWCPLPPGPALTVHEALLEPRALLV